MSDPVSPKKTSPKDGKNKNDADKDTFIDNPFFFQ